MKGESQMEKGHRADWLYRAKWGVFSHYLAEPDLTAEAWNRRVYGFDVENVAGQLASAGARYYLFSVGQNSGHWCAPNGTYDRLVGRTPSRCSTRDLIAELAVALGKRGIRTMVYLPSHAPAKDRQACIGLRCTPPFDASAWQLRERLPGAERTDEAVSEFQLNWEAVIREWSERWGEWVSGWWVDGVYFADRMYRRTQTPNFITFAAAMRAGNPKAIVAFNDGQGCPHPMPVRSMTEQEDYTAFELDYALTFSGHQPPDHPVNSGRWIQPCEGARVQRHVTTFLGEWWMHGKPRFPDELVVGYTRHVNEHGGVVTWDVPISDAGHIPDAFVRQLSCLRDL